MMLLKLLRSTPSSRKLACQPMKTSCKTKTDDLTFFFSSRFIPISIIFFISPFISSNDTRDRHTSTMSTSHEKEQNGAPPSSSSSAAYGASCTSFYTNEQKKDSYQTLDDVLSQKCSDPLIRQVVKEMLDVCADITEALRTALVTVEGSTNDFGDSQLSVDMIADKLIWDAVRKSTVVREGASEEDPIVRNVDETGCEGEFTVCWDPLDGSSIVDNNWAVGTLMGIWPKSTGLIGATGRDQVTSLVALYGPRTTVLVALDDGTYEFTYGAIIEGSSSSSSSSTSVEDAKDKTWICSRHKIQIQQDCKIFSPANLRAAQDLPGYRTLVDYFMEHRYTLRYSGGLVPDVYQQFTKTQGIFCNPTSETSPAKLRLAFEAAPFGLLVEKSGGMTSDGVTGGSILDVPIHAVDQRTPLCLGSANEVKRFNEMLELKS
jgi:sedoheptulose-bisphosphatase